MTVETSDRTIVPTGATLRVPDHVVHRAFAAETVILNLQTGRYHGLNPTAGLMLAAIERAGTMGEAAEQLVAALGAPRADIERDLTEFCASLVARGLLEVIE